MSERKITIVPSVAMNGGIFPTETSSPFAVPPTAPTPAAITPAITAAHSGETGSAFIPRIESTPERASSEPTERSMPPAAMTNVMPSAIMPLYDTCRMMLTRFWTLRKLSLETQQTISSRTSAA